MRKVSQILLLIGAILSIVAAVGLFIGAIVCAYLATPEVKQMVIEMINSGQVSTQGLSGTPEEIATALQVLFGTYATVMFIFMGTSILCAIFSFIARAKQKTAFYVLAIVFGVCSTVVSLVGGIFGLIANARNE